MSGQRIEELAESLDTEDMCGLTRGFVDDLEKAFSSDTGLESDLDWTGVISVSYTHLTLPTIYSV